MNFQDIFENLSNIPTQVIDLSNHTTKMVHIPSHCRVREPPIDRTFLDSCFLMFFFWNGESWIWPELIIQMWDDTTNTANMNTKHGY